MTPFSRRKDGQLISEKARKKAEDAKRTKRAEWDELAASYDVATKLGSVSTWIMLGRGFGDACRSAGIAAAEVADLLDSGTDDPYVLGELQPLRTSLALHAIEAVAA